MAETVDTTPRDEELALLKERADLMGIKYSGNIGIDTLKAKINERLEEAELKKDEKKFKADLRKTERDKQLKLVRIRLSVMNPSKQNWTGEIFTIANSVIGTVRKFVPYEPKFYTNGYHVPFCIYNLLKEKKFVNRTTKNVNGRIIATERLVPEFSIEVLPKLTKEELAELAKEQAAGNRIDETDE